MQRYNLPRMLAIAACVVGLLPALPAAPAGAEAAPVVVASIKPVHSLVAAVMEGVGRPVLIVHGAGSPHTYSMRPSDARALHEAQVIVWLGPTLEQFLRQPLEALGGKARVVTLAQVPAIKHLPQRAGGAWDVDADDPQAPRAFNSHLWLDPHNAQAMVDAVAKALEDTDPAHAATYRVNAARERERLAALDAELERELAPLRDKPYLVFHDAYPYFEARYRLKAVGSITVNPDQPPGARRISELRRRIGSSGVLCVFAEPEFRPHLVQTLIEGSRARSGVLDPLGADLPDGPELYFTLMRNLARELQGCLAGRQSQ
jgi:zinc transport system substrate-binding protein